MAVLRRGVSLVPFRPLSAAAAHAAPRLSDEALLSLALSATTAGAGAADASASRPLRSLSTLDLARVLALSAELHGVPGVETPDARALLLAARAACAGAAAAAASAAPSSAALLAAAAGAHALIVTAQRPDVRAWLAAAGPEVGGRAGPAAAAAAASSRQTLVDDFNRTASALLDADAWPPVAAADAVFAIAARGDEDGGASALSPAAAAAAARYFARHADALSLGDAARALAGLGSASRHADEPALRGAAAAIGKRVLALRAAAETETAADRASGRAAAAALPRARRALADADTLARALVALEGVAPPGTRRHVARLAALHLRTASAACPPDEPGALDGAALSHALAVAYHVAILTPPGEDDFGAGAGAGRDDDRGKGDGADGGGHNGDSRGGGGGGGGQSERARAPHQPSFDHRLSSDESATRFLVHRVCELVKARLARLSPADALFFGLLRAHIDAVWTSLWKRRELLDRLRPGKPSLQRGAAGEWTASLLDPLAGAAAAVRLPRGARPPAELAALAAAVPPSYSVGRFYTDEWLPLDAACAARREGVVVTRRSDYLVTFGAARGGAGAADDLAPGAALRSALLVAAAKGWRVDVVMLDDLLRRHGRDTSE